jgi:hypothetical protein
MKKWILFFLLTIANLQALYVGNPYQPGAVEKGMFICDDAVVGLKVGYQADFVLDRRLKSYGGVSSRIDDFQSQWNQGVITLSLAERVDFYGSLGAMQASFSHRPGPDHYRREYDTSYKFTWGFGARAIVYEWKHCSIGVEGSYQWAKPPIKWDALNGTSFTTSADLHYQEWQVGLGISRQIQFLIPYGVFKYSNVHAKATPLRSDLDLPVTSLKMTNRDHFGLALGCTFTTGKDFDLTVESRFIDEQAVSLAGNLRF